jgi:hypothetical protein
MKTSLAIVLATAALMVSATASVAVGGWRAPVGYSNKGLCGVTFCSNPDQAPIPSPPGPGPYRGQM